jgi:hypothetical protein
MERRNFKKSLADLTGLARSSAARYARRGVIVF